MFANKHYSNQPVLQSQVTGHQISGPTLIRKGSHQQDQRSSDLLSQLVMGGQIDKENASSSQVIYSYLRQKKEQEQSKGQGHLKKENSKLFNALFNQSSDTPTGVNISHLLSQSNKQFESKSSSPSPARVSSSQLKLVKQSSTPANDESVRNCHGGTGELKSATSTNNVRGPSDNKQGWQDCSAESTKRKSVNKSPMSKLQSYMSTSSSKLNLLDQTLQLAQQTMNQSKQLKQSASRASIAAQRPSSTNKNKRGSTAGGLYAHGSDLSVKPKSTFENKKGSISQMNKSVVHNTSTYSKFLANAQPSVSTYSKSGSTQGKGLTNARKPLVASQLNNSNQRPQSQTRKDGLAKDRSLSNLNGTHVSTGHTNQVLNKSMQGGNQTLKKNMSFLGLATSNCSTTSMNHSISQHSKVKGYSSVMGKPGAKKESSSKKRKSMKKLDTTLHPVPSSYNFDDILMSLDHQISTNKNMKSSTKDLLGKPKINIKELKKCIVETDSRCKQHQTIQKTLNDLIQDQVHSEYGEALSIIKRWYREEFERATKVLEIEITRRKQAEAKLAEYEQKTSSSLPPKSNHNKQARSQTFVPRLDLSKVRPDLTTEEEDDEQEEGNNETLEPQKEFLHSDDTLDQLDSIQEHSVMGQNKQQLKPSIPKLDFTKLKTNQSKAHQQQQQQQQTKVNKSMQLDLTKLKKGSQDFQDEFMEKFEEYSESWREKIKKDQRHGY